MNRATKIIAAILSGLVATVAGHLIAFACAKGVFNESFGLPSIAAGNFTYAVVEGLFSTIAIVGILVAAGTHSKALLISVGYGALVTFVVALPAIGILIDTEDLHLGVFYANVGLLPGMFLAVFFRLEFRALMQRRRVNQLFQPSARTRRLKSTAGRGWKGIMP